MKNVKVKAFNTELEIKRTEKLNKATYLRVDEIKAINKYIALFSTNIEPLTVEENYLINLTDQYNIYKVLDIFSDIDLNKFFERVIL